jgi:hypothetical protein
MDTTDRTCSTPFEIPDDVLSILHRAADYGFELAGDPMGSWDENGNDRPGSSTPPAWSTCSASASPRRITSPVVVHSCRARLSWDKTASRPPRGIQGLRIYPSWGRCRHGRMSLNACRCWRLASRRPRSGEAQSEA